MFCRGCSLAAEEIVDGKTTSGFPSRPRSLPDAVHAARDRQALETVCRSTASRARSWTRRRRGGWTDPRQSLANALEMALAVMGFSVDPGPLPFVTGAPRDKWGPRLAGMTQIDLQCDRAASPCQRGRALRSRGLHRPDPRAPGGPLPRRAAIAVHLEPMLTFKGVPVVFDKDMECPKTNQPAGRLRLVEGREREGAVRGPPQPGFEPKQEEKDAVKVWSERIERAETNPAYKTWVTDLASWRGYVAGTEHKDKTKDSSSGPTWSRDHRGDGARDLREEPGDRCHAHRRGAAGADGQRKKFASTPNGCSRRCWSRRDGSRSAPRRHPRHVDDVDRRAEDGLPDRAARDPIIIRRIEDSQDKLAKVEALRAKLRRRKTPPSSRSSATSCRQREGAQVAQRCAHLQGFPIDRLKSETS